VYKRKGLRFGEMFYEVESETKGKVDILRILSSDKLTNFKLPAKEGHTLVIDLSHDEQALFDEMDKGTRYEVRRSMSKDNLVYKYNNECSNHDVQMFCDYYNTFAASKNLRPVFRPRLDLLALDKRLVLTSSLGNDNSVIVWHAYFLCGSRIVLLYSASLFRQTDDSSLRQLIGRANRFTHWNDIVTSKRNGCLLYDMGGIDITNRTDETQRIAVFKKGFGGSIVMNYNYTLPKSILGYAACKVLGILGKNI
jgi:lipid II:glycine glycyltransferase (peptidoglycan interpeptide bridge formation enzyme)